MGIVEGLTEFLPISSTGHLILMGSLLNFAAPPFGQEKAQAFDIAIQTGAIFAIILVYWQKIRTTMVALPRSHEAQRFVFNILIGFLPAVNVSFVLPLICFVVVTIYGYRTIKGIKMSVE